MTVKSSTSLCFYGTVVCCAFPDDTPALFTMSQDDCYKGRYDGVEELCTCGGVAAYDQFPLPLRKLLTVFHDLKIDIIASKESH